MFNMRLMVTYLLYIIWVLVTLAALFFFLNTTAVGDAETGREFSSLAFVVGTIVYIVLILLPLRIFGQWFKFVPPWKTTIFTDGKQATATVLNARGTRNVLYPNPNRFLLRLQVQPPAESPFEVSLVKKVYTFENYHEGESVQVRYDPNNKNHVIIVSEPG